ncbi:MAG: RsmD family RNA methyltransferase [Candidatus Heimdallarchaeota archaeon]|nr:MAG: RsmD family RNA methyltransferase [Candidatus Heimdallarchaeota archaeon]
MEDKSKITMQQQENNGQSFFFLLSGENPELAVFELESIVSALNIPVELRISPDNRVIVIQIETKKQNILSSDIISFLMKRVTLVHFSCKQLFQIDFTQFPPQSLQDLTSNFDTSTFCDLMPNTSFSVFTKRIGEPIEVHKPRSLTQALSRYLGTQIIQKNPTKWVDLENPQEQFISILSKHGLWFGQLVSHSLRKNVQQRAAHKRPFFHPSSMNPLLQRTMVNLTAIKTGEWLLDPFCGAGGALLEAARLGIHSIGVEINRKIIWGAYQNLKADKIANDLTHLIFGDATQLSFKKGSISAVVTDPPYGTASSTRGFDLQDLLLAFFREIRPLLSPKARVVIAIPSKIEIDEQIAQILNASYRKFLQYVHRSLTRKILVFSIPKRPSKIQ